jgi:hypothetical protein
MTTPQEKSEIVKVIGQDGHGYEIDFTKDKIYIIKYEKYANYLFKGLAIAFFLLVIYDWLKDQARVFSGYRDVMRGKGANGVSKLFGLTPGNIKRWLGMAGLILVAFLVLKYLERTKKEIDPSMVPIDVSAVILEEANKRKIKLFKEDDMKQIKNEVQQLMN